MESSCPYVTTLQGMLLDQEEVLEAVKLPHRRMAVGVLYQIQALVCNLDKPPKCRFPTQPNILAFEIATKPKVKCHMSSDNKLAERLFLLYFPYSK